MVASNARHVQHLKRQYQSNNTKGQSEVEEEKIGETFEIDQLLSLSTASFSTKEDNSFAHQSTPSNLQNSTEAPSTSGIDLSHNSLLHRDLLELNGDYFTQTKPKDEAAK